MRQLLGAGLEVLDSSQISITLQEKLEDPEQRPGVLLAMQRISKSNPASLIELLKGAPELSRKLLKIQLDLGISQVRMDGDERVKTLAEKLSALLNTMSDYSNSAA
eukprot:g8485.t1